MLTRVSMIRRTLKHIEGNNIKDLRYLPQFKEFQVLNIKGRFEI